MTSAQATVDPPADPTFPATELEKANRLLAEGSYADAAQVLDAGLEVLQAGPDKDSLSLVRLLLPAAIAQAKLGNVERGKAYFDEAFALLGEVVANRDQQKIAQEYLDEAHAILVGISGSEPDWAGQCFMSLGAAYFSVGEVEKADALIAKAVAIRASTWQPTPLHRVAPAHPKACLERQINGEVAVELGIDEKGRVRDVEVVDVHMWRDTAQQTAHDEACRKKLVKAATRAAREFRFLPKLSGGSAVAAEGLETTISFHTES